MKQKAIDIWNEFKKERTAVELVKEGKYSKNTIYKYWELWQINKELSQKIEDLILKSA